MTPKGIHSRGYLPHWDFAKSVQAITFRLDDSLPAAVVKEWKMELKDLLESPDSSPKAKAELHRRISRYEDSGIGSCLLGTPEVAQIVQVEIISGHPSNYKLIEWCIMPNHVHVLIRLMPESSLGNIVKNWKAVTAVKINRMLNRTGRLWMPDYHDRYIRDFDHFYDSKTYIRNNPVKAKLCEKPQDWAFSSAGIQWDANLTPQPGARDSSRPI